MTRAMLGGALGALASAAAAGTARAAEIVGAPVDWRLNLQQSGSGHMADVHLFHDWLLALVALILAFVLLLLLWVIVRYRAAANPTPGTRTHNPVLEVLWTVIPTLILVAVAVPSFRILYQGDVVPPADMTLKAVGSQWYWSYEYPDHGGFAFDAFQAFDGADFEPGRPFTRLLSTDTAVVVPSGTTVRVQVTANDVLHSWAIPALGVKMDAVPGRLNETWFRAEREGIYYGQCSELCGVNHGHMPIELHVVPPAAFEAWAAEAREIHARRDRPGSPTTLAARGAR